MTRELLQHLYAGLAPWMALSLLMLGRNPHLSRTRIAGSLLLAFFLLRIPVDGWHGFAWIRMLEPNPSFTLTVLLGIALSQRVSLQKTFRPADWNAAWIVGAAASLALYPMGLGLTAHDAYTWGWGPRIPILTAAVAALLLLRGNRFGVILLLPFVGFLLHLQESTNFWDAVIDPFYGGVSLLLVSSLIIHGFLQAVGAKKNA